MTKLIIKVLILALSSAWANPIAAPRKELSIQIKYGERETEFFVEKVEGQYKLHFTANNGDSRTSLLSSNNFKFIVKKTQGIESRQIDSSAMCPRTRIVLDTQAAIGGRHYQGCLFSRNRTNTKLLNLTKLLTHLL